MKPTFTSRRDTGGPRRLEKPALLLEVLLVVLVEVVVLLEVLLVVLPGATKPATHRAVAIATAARCDRREACSMAIGADTGTREGGKERETVTRATNRATTLHVMGCRTRGALPLNR
jgi:hypothetical protein